MAALVFFALALVIALTIHFVEWKQGRRYPEPKQSSWTKRGLADGYKRGLTLQEEAKTDPTLFVGNKEYRRALTDWEKIADGSEWGSMEHQDTPANQYIMAHVEGQNRARVFTVYGVHPK